MASMALVQPEVMDAVVDELVGPPMPPLAERAWDVFGQLSGTRASGMGGVGAITYTEMDAYQRLTGTTLTALDVALVREADAAFLSYAYRKLKAAGTRDDDDSPED
jgi:hypothetical protein